MQELVALKAPDGNLVRNDSGMWPLYSITKTYIAATVIALGIELDQPVARWIEPHWIPRGADISVRQLLNHTSGLRDYGGLVAYRRAVAERQDVWSDELFAEATLHQPLLFEPGSGWSYSNPGYWLLTKIAERESGLRLQTVLERCLLDPLDLQHTRLATGVFANEFGLDQRLIGYPAGWVWHGLLVGSPGDTATFMASDLVTPLRGTLTTVPGTHAHWKAPHYGLGLMIEPGQRFGHNGGGPGYSASCFRFEGTRLDYLRADPQRGRGRCHGTPARSGRRVELIPVVLTSLGLWIFGLSRGFGRRRPLYRSQPEHHLDRFQIAGLGFGPEDRIDIQQILVTDSGNALELRQRFRHGIRTAISRDEVVAATNQRVCATNEVTSTARNQRKTQQRIAHALLSAFLRYDPS